MAALASSMETPGAANPITPRKNGTPITLASISATAPNIRGSQGLRAGMRLSAGRDRSRLARVSRNSPTTSATNTALRQEAASRPCPSSRP